jgi:hypothetical protein
MPAIVFWRSARSNVKSLDRPPGNPYDSPISPELTISEKTAYILPSEEVGMKILKLPRKDGFFVSVIYKFGR